MTLTLDDLIELEKDPSYNRLPIVMAEEAVGKEARWWKLQEEMTIADAKIQTWEAAQYIAVLLDTYPGLVEEVHFKIFRELDSGELTNYVYINNEECYDGTYPLDEDVLEAMEKIDGMRALKAAVGWLYDFPSARLGRHHTLPAKAFEEPIHTADQARAIGGAQAPAVEAFINARQLESQLPPATATRRVRPRA